MSAQQTSRTAEQSFDALMHVSLQVTAELGSCLMPIADVLKLGSGSIVELDRPAGDPIDICVDGKVLARGEIVCVDDSFGVRIVELIRQPA